MPQQPQRWKVLTRSEKSNNKKIPAKSDFYAGSFWIRFFTYKPRTAAGQMGIYAQMLRHRTGQPIMSKKGARQRNESKTGRIERGDLRIVGRIAGACGAIRAYTCYKPRTAAEQMRIYAQMFRHRTGQPIMSKKGARQEKERETGRTERGDLRIIGRIAGACEAIRAYTSHKPRMAAVVP